MRRLVAILLGLLLALPAAAQTIRIVSPWEVGALDPLRTGYLFTRMQVAETLLGTDTANRLVPALAAGWSLSDDQLAWRFALRPEARFHDGTPVDAAAVVAALKRASMAPGILATAPVSTIEADGAAVVIRTQRPFAALPAFLANFSALVLAPSSYAADGTVRSVIGSGPYKVTSITAPQGFEVERSGTWWGGTPAIARAIYLAVGRGETRTLMAESGEADLVYVVPAIGFDRLRRSPRVALTVLPIPRSYTVKINSGSPFFDQVEERRALSMAIDRRGIATAILRNPDAAATQLLPPALGDWHDAALPKLTYDPAGARRMLEQLGWRAGADGILARDGRAFRVTIRTFPDRPDQPVMAAAMQAMLKDVGIALDVAIVNSSDIPAGHRDGSLILSLQARNFSLVPDPLGTILQDFGPDGGDWGAMGWSSPELVGLLTQLGGTFDQEAARPLRQRIAAILQDQLPVLPIAWFDHSVAASRRMQGVTLDPFELSYRLSDMKLTE